MGKDFLSFHGCRCHPAAELALSFMCDMFNRGGLLMTPRKGNTACPLLLEWVFPSTVFKGTYGVLTQVG
jgi:hypothetical protein